MTAREIAIAARYVRDCANAARRRIEQSLVSGLTPNQQERLSGAQIDMQHIEEFNRLASVDCPLQGSDTKPLPAVAEGLPGVAALLDEAVKMMPRVTSLPEHVLGGSIRHEARTTELLVNQARGAIRTYLAA